MNVWAKEKTPVEYCVEVNDDGKEYFSIPNVKDSENQLFLNKIKDCIEAIRNDDGDVISINDSGLAFLGGEDVYKFVDREYGEKLRQQTIKGWENTKFCYIIEKGYKNSFNSPREVKENGSYFIDGIDNKEDRLIFNTQKEAEKFLNEVYELSERLQNRYNDLIINYPNKVKKFFKTNLENNRLALELVQEKGFKEPDVFYEVAQSVII